MNREAPFSGSVSSRFLFGTRTVESADFRNGTEQNCPIWNGLLLREPKELTVLAKQNRDHPDKVPSKQTNRNRAFRRKQIGQNFANPLPFRVLPRTVRHHLPHLAIVTREQKSSDRVGSNRISGTSSECYRAKVRAQSASFQQDFPAGQGSRTDKEKVHLSACLPTTGVGDVVNPSIPYPAVHKNNEEVSTRPGSLPPQAASSHLRLSVPLIGPLEQTQGTAAHTTHTTPSNSSSSSHNTSTRRSEK